MGFCSPQPPRFAPQVPNLPVSRPPSRSSKLGLHVLYADDAVANQKLGTRYLEKLGCTVAVVSDGMQVVHTLQESGQLPRQTGEQPRKSKPRLRLRPFDVLCLDINMPHIRGDELVEMYRDTVGVPFIAMSGDVSDEESQRLLRLGFAVCVCGCGCECGCGCGCGLWLWLCLYGCQALVPLT